jgi:hypothetical protein
MATYCPVGSGAPASSPRGQLANLFTSGWTPTTPGCSAIRIATSLWSPDGPLTQGHRAALRFTNIPPRYRSRLLELHDDSPRLAVSRLRIVDDQLKVRRLGPDLCEVRDTFRGLAVSEQAAVSIRTISPSSVNGVNRARTAAEGVPGGVHNPHGVQKRLIEVGCERRCVVSIQSKANFNLVVRTFGGLPTPSPCWGGH